MFKVEKTIGCYKKTECDTGFGIFVLLYVLKKR